MTKAELKSAVKKLQEEEKVSPVDAIIEVIKDQVQQGNEVVILGFGTFSLKTRKSGTFRNPKTGEIAQFPENRKIAFKGYKI